MRNLSILAGAIALASVSAVAQTVLVPSTTLGPFAGTSGNYFTAGGINRFQMIYDTTHFTSQGVLAPISITQVEFQYGGGATPVNIVTFPSVSVYLQPSAVDWVGQSTTFASNRTIAFPTTPNFTGSVSTTTGTYYVTIPLTTPISYDPTAGVDLLLEVEVNGAPTPALGNIQACTFTATPPANLCNVKRSVGSITALTGANSAFVPIVNFTYTPAPNAGIATPIGSGCIKHFNSYYEEFAAPANFDLAGTALTFVPDGLGGYTIVRTGSFLPVGSVQASPTTLVLGDDAEVLQPLTVGSFVGPDGLPWASLDIVSNGVITNAAHPAAVAGGGAPTINTFLNPVPDAFYCLGDFDPSTATGGGTVTFEESAGVISITWTDVPNWTATPPAAGLNTFQFQLYPSGFVTMAFGNLNSFGNNGGVRVGYSKGGVSLDPGSSDISAIGAGFAIVEAADINPLTLVSVNRPVVNTTWNLNVTDIPALALPQIGVEIYGFSDPGINDLFFLGAPGCPLRANLDILNPFITVGGSHAYSLPVPNAPTLVGVTFFLQSAVLDASYNSFGAITSNGISGLIGSI